ncbi:probable glutamate receptor [Periplaneta americana]|uniref:probable glutamate receptor n=1 Tax=Periplaneta americana TaxID=6978 RepID=UPI0037E8625A
MSPRGPKIEEIESTVQRVVKDALRDMLQDAGMVPVLADTIKDAVTSAVVVELQKNLDFKKDLISDFKSALEQKDRRIEELEYKLDDLEQYQRRQCLRIFGVGESNDEDTVVLAISVAEKVGVDLSLVDIDRSHRKLDLEKMSQYKWLLLSDAEDFLDDLFAGVDIPFDCELLVARRHGKVVLLTEVYRISPTHPLHKAHFGNWTPLQGLMSQAASLYRRRNSLRGLQLKTSTINGTLIKITKSINNKPVKVGGHFGDVWHLLENTLQFLSDFYTPQNLWYGADQGNGSWTGVVGQVLNREVEVTNADLIVNKPRSEVVAFISPIELDRQILVIKLPDTKDLVWDSFLKPLNPELYAVVLLCIVIFSISLSYSKKLLQKVKPRYIVASMVDVNAFSFPHALLSTFGVFCSQGHDEAPNFLSTRLILLAAYVTAVVIVTSYSACLLSFIMTKVYGLPFNNFEEFLKDGTYQLEILAQSSTLMYFKTSQNMLMKTIYRKMIAPHESTLPKSITEGLHRVCARRKVATVNFESFLSSNIRKLNCTLQRVPHAFMAASKSMATRKNSPYRGILKVTLNNMVRSGIIQVIHERNFPDKFTVSEEEFVSVSLIDVIPIISVLAVGIVAAIMLLLVERLIAKNCVVKNKEIQRTSSGEKATAICT